MQLQADLKKFEAEGIQIVAISYDPVEVLSGFADKRQITFPLLSDPGSKTIEAYGILNKEATSGRAKGVPYPGTFLVDKEGVVRAKLFLEGYRERHPTEELLKAAQAIGKPIRKESNHDANRFGSARPFIWSGLSAPIRTSL